MCSLVIFQNVTILGRPAAAKCRKTMGTYVTSKALRGLYLPLHNLYATGEHYSGCCVSGGRAGEGAISEETHFLLWGPCE